VIGLLDLSLLPEITADDGEVDDVAADVSAFSLLPPNGFRDSCTGAGNHGLTTFAGGAGGCGLSSLSSHLLILIPAVTNASRGSLSSIGAGGGGLTSLAGGAGDRGLPSTFSPSLVFGTTVLIVDAVDVSVDASLSSTFR
jgi:hypothetical protein